MATFYKYKDRDDITKSMIDWSGITKDISDNLMKEKDRRDTLKSKIEEDQLQKLKAIDEYSKGIDLTMNQSMLKVAQNYKDYLLNSHKLMKQGLASVADTKIQKQGAMDTFNGINDAVKGYNEKIGAIAEAGGTLNDYLASNIARALDISKSQLVIDKMGRGSFVTMDEDGNEIVLPATSLGTILNKKFNRFNTTIEVVNVVKGLGDWVKTSAGGYKSVSDLRERGDEFYKKTLNAKVESILNSEDRVVEAAADMMGMKVTQDKNLYESEPDKYILSEMKGGKIKLSANKEAVSKNLYNQIDAAISRTEKEIPRPVIRKTASDIKDKEVSSLIENFVVNGDFSALKSALSQKGFKGSMAPDENGVINLIDSQGNAYKVETKNKNAKQVGQEIAGFLKVGQYFKDRNITTNLNPGILDETNKSNYGMFVSSTEPTKVNTKENIKSLISSLEFDLRGNKIPKEKMSDKVYSFKGALQAISGPYNIETNVDSEGNVTINGMTIPKGIDNPPLVLSRIEEIVNKSKSITQAP